MAKKTSKNTKKPPRRANPYMAWLKKNRASIKKKYPSFSGVEIAKKAGELYRQQKK